LIGRESDISIRIHSTAILSPDAQLGENVSIGPYSVINNDVQIGDNTQIENFVTVGEGTKIGHDCRIFHGAVVGEIPQDLKFGGERTQTIVGNHTTIREYVTINKGTVALGRTELGSHVLLMAYVHIGHDSIVGDHVIFANQVTLGGHVEVGDWVSLGGGVLVHQFSKIGSHAFVAAGFRVVQDVPPYILAAGEPLRFAGINKIGLERRGFSTETRQAIKKAYRKYFRSGTNRADALKAIEKDENTSDELEQIISFIQKSERGVI
jgi:UDP-N-acetylglucosamine acyltransferase